MTRSKRNEVSYYPEIMSYLKEQIESNFKASKNPLTVYCKTGELRKGLKEIIRENRITTTSILELASNIPPLSLDIFALITDGVQYELLILEIKLLDSVGLTQLSQLIGYCIVSNAQYGLLVNVDGGESPRLTDLLMNELDLTFISRDLKYKGKKVNHNLGVMEWNSATRNLEYTEYGSIRSMAELCKKLSEKFENKD